MFSCCIAAVCFGCSAETHVSETRLGAGYSLQTLFTPSWLMEPGGGSREFHLLHTDSSGKTILISNDATGGFGQLFPNSYDTHLYGNNLIYLERYSLPGGRGPLPEDQGPDVRIRLMAYSQKNRFVIIDCDFQRYVKASGDDRGITCYQRADPHPTFYSAEYLQGL